MHSPIFRNIIVPSLLLIVNCTVLGQNRKVEDEKQCDSLKQLLSITQNIGKRIVLLNSISQNFNESNLDSAYYYSIKAIKLLPKVSNSKLVADTYFSLGITYRNKGVSDSADYYLLNALKIYEEQNDKENAVKTMTAYGEYCRANYLLKKAVDYEQKAISLSYKYHIQKYLPAAYNRLGAIYYELSVNNKVVDGYFKDSVMKAISFIDSSIYWSGKNNSAQFNVSNNNILGACYRNIKDYRKANYHLSKALWEAKSEDDFFEMPMIYRNLSLNFLKTEDYDRAIEMASTGARMADSLRMNASLWQNYYALFLINEKIKNDKLAIHYLKKADSLQGVVYDENIAVKTKEFEARYKNRENEIIIKNQESKIEKQQLQFISSLVGLLAAIVLITTSILVVIRIRKTNRLLAAKNKALENAAYEIKKLSTFKDDLTSMVVHDLKNPLNTIINYSKLLEHDIAEDTMNVNDKNNCIQITALEMINMVNNIIDINKSEETELKLNLSLCSLNDILLKVLNDFEILLAQKNIRINNPITQEFICELDSDLFKRVFTNLLSNAVKFSPNNGIITISFENTDNLVKVSIADTGQGIVADKIPLLFKKYARAEIRQYGYTSSSGLGLAFSKIVVNAHGGEIGVKSQPGRGSCFWFTVKYNSLIQGLNTPVINEKSAAYGNEFLQAIFPLKNMLLTFQFYETGEILNVLNNFKCSYPEFVRWRKEIENAILNSNKEKYEDLINSLP